MFSEGLSIDQVRELRRAIAAESALLFQRSLVEDNALGNRHDVPVAAQTDDAHVGAWQLSRFKHCGEQQLGEQRVTHVVCAKLDLVALFRRAVRGRHDTRVVDQDVETRLAALECRGCFGDGREGCQVKGEVLNVAGVGDRGFDRSNGIVGFGLAAGGEIDACGVVGGKICNCLLA